MTNYYSCLAPPTCQVEEQETTIDSTIEQGKGSIQFEIPKTKSKNKSYKSQMERYQRAKTSKQALKAARDAQYREIPWGDMKVAIEARSATKDNMSSVIAAATLASLRRTKRDKVPRKDQVYVIDYDDDEMRCGVLNGTIPSAVADSGASSNVGTKDDPCPRTGKPSNKVFILPGGQTVTATEMATYPFNVRAPASEIHITPGITSNSLLSTGKYAEADYITIFDKDQVNVYDVNDVAITVTRGAILRGWKDPKSGLWRIPLLPTIRQTTVSNANTETVLVNKPPTEFLPQRPPSIEAIANVYELKTQPEIVRYYHAAAGFPTKPTWLKAIKNNHYASWTGLSYEGVNKHFPESEETHKGHARKLKSGQRSTKKKRKAVINGEPDPDERIPRASSTAASAAAAASEESDEEDTNWPQAREQGVMFKIVQLDVDHDKEEEELLRVIYSDGTGRLPKTSRRGMNYIMVMVEIDSKAILAEAMRNRSAKEQCRAYQHLLDRLHSYKIFPKKHILDNEISDDLKAVIKLNKLEYELVPPHDHRRNIAEKGIQTYKSHLISILCGTDKDFPLYLWCDLLPQVEHTLNLLRPSGKLPTVSAYAYLHGQHNYDRHPFAPLGCKVEAHVMPSNRETWAEHTVSGYYIGCSHEHYRCHQVYVTSTRHIRVFQTVFFKHKYLTQPTFTSHDALIRAADKLADAISGTIPKNSTTENGIKSLLDIFKQQANVAKNRLDAKAKQMNDAATQRVQDERQKEATTQPSNLATAQRVPTATTTFETENKPTDQVNGKRNNVPTITQDEDETPTTTHTSNRVLRSETRSLTDEFLYNAMEFPGVATTFATNNRASPKQTQQVMPDWINAVINKETGEPMEYRHLLKDPKQRERWLKSFGKEIRRLVTTTKTIKFVSWKNIPKDRLRDITYARICCNERPEKTDPYRTRITMGGNLINYPGDCGTPTADLLTVKLLLNSVISTLRAKFMTIDIKDFYLMTPMERREYFRIKLELFPEDVIDEYDLRSLVDDKGYIFCEVQRGMYGLPQAGILAQEQLEIKLNKAGYTQSKITPGFWKHAWRPISFTLVVDDFGIKYVGKEHAEHLISVLKQDYEIDTDWEGTRYLGLTLDWDYTERQVHLSMPGYIAKALLRFAHPTPSKPQHQPHPHTERRYGATIQYAKNPDDSPLLLAEDKTFIQQVLGVLLYYGRAVDATILVALSSIASMQAAPTELTMKLIKMLLDYVATNPDAILTYKKSNMVLMVHSDASYLSEPGARSRAGGHFFMSTDTDNPPNNGAVLNMSQIIKSVMSSAAEAELGALYINACEAVAIRQLLNEMGHKQPRTPIQTDNSTALGVVTNNIQPRRTKAMDMRYYWLRCRDAQGQFKYYWKPGPTNLADY